MSEDFFIFAYDRVVGFYPHTETDGVSSFDTFVDTASTLGKAVKKLTGYIDFISDNQVLMADIEAYIVDMRNLTAVVGLFRNDGNIPGFNMKPAYQLELMFNTASVNVDYISGMNPKLKPGVNGKVLTVGRWKIKE